MRSKLFTRVFLLISLVVFGCSIFGVFATWKFAEQPTPETKKEVDIGSVVFKYYDELVIKKITTVSSSVASEESKIDPTTKIASTITGNYGQKIVYRMEAYNYSKTESFIFVGSDNNNLSSVSVTASIDQQGSDLLVDNLSSNAQSGTVIGPGEDFVFYVTYNLTSNVLAENVLVNYVFKPIIYTVTYLHNNQTFATEYVTDNSYAYSVISQKPAQSGATFAGWVNVNAAVINQIPAKNTSNYILTASWDKVYLIIFADVQGNVLYEEQFTSSSTSLSQKGQAEVDRILAELNAEAKDKHMSVSWSDYEIKGAKGDITVKAIYAYNGQLNLVPIYEQPDDGIVDYYQVEAVDSLDSVVTIPGMVNGIPVKTVFRIANTAGANDYNNYAEKVETIIIEEGVEYLQIPGGNDKVNTNALAYTPNLKLVKLPSTIKYIGKNTFSRNFGDDKKVLTIEFNGTMAEWRAIQKHEDWDHGLKRGSVVKCSDGYFEQTSLLSTSWKERNY